MSRRYESDTTGFKPFDRYIKRKIKQWNKAIHEKRMRIPGGTDFSVTKYRKVDDGILVAGEKRNNRSDPVNKVIDVDVWLVQKDTIQFIQSYTTRTRRPENDIRIIRMHMNDTSGFKPLDNFEATEKGSTRRRLARLSRSLKSGNIEGQTLCSLWGMNNWPVYLQSEKYKITGDGILLSGDRYIWTDVIDSRPQYKTLTADIYYIGNDKRVLLVHTYKRTVTNRFWRPVTGSAIPDTLAFAYEFPQDDSGNAAFSNPRFMDGNKALVGSAVKNIRPELQEEIFGTVIVSFIVMPDSTITQVKREEGFYPGCDWAALHFVRQMQGKWLPGRMNGECVPVKVTMRIVFDYRYGRMNL